MIFLLIMTSYNVLDLIGKTPFLNLTKSEKISYNLYCKLEYLQPGGSIKDRVALQIIKDAYAYKKLSKRQVVVEMTSGNMGAGLAIVCKHYGNPFIAVMSKGNSKERIKILNALGAEVILVDQIDGTSGMVTGKDIEYATIIAKEITNKRDGFFVDQFNNQSCIKAHYNNTGPEIFSEIPEMDAFVTSIGSGGTFIGISKYLKSKNKNIKCIAVEPKDTAIIKYGSIKSPRHIIQGIGYGIIPPHWDNNLVDYVTTVSDKEVLKMTKKLSKKYGLYVGYSSGANVVASLKYAKKNKEVKNIVTILCDTGYKYTDL